MKSGGFVIHGQYLTAIFVAMTFDTEEERRAAVIAETQKIRNTDGGDRLVENTKSVLQGRLGGVEPKTERRYIELLGYLN